MLNYNIDYQTAIGKFKEVRTLLNETDVKVVEAKVLEYDQVMAFEQGYQKVLRKEQRVIIKFVRLEIFNENEIVCPQ